TPSTTSARPWPWYWDSSSSPSRSRRWYSAAAGESGDPMTTTSTAPGQGETRRERRRRERLEESAAAIPLRLYGLKRGTVTALSAFAGYGFARFRFRGSKALFYVVVGALLVPVGAITLPLYLVYAKAHMINSIWGLVLPSMVSPVGVYLMRTYVELSVPREL